MYKSVHKHFGKLHALKGASLAIERGEFFGLPGPNDAARTGYRYCATPRGVCRRNSVTPGKIPDLLLQGKARTGSGPACGEQIKLRPVYRGLDIHQAKHRVEQIVV